MGLRRKAAQDLRKLVTSISKAQAAGRYCADKVA